MNASSPKYGAWKEVRQKESTCCLMPFKNKILGNAHYSTEMKQIRAPLAGGGGGGQHKEGGIELKGAG